MDCPICRSPLQFEELRPAASTHPELQERLDGLSVFCTHAQDYGCNFIGPRSELDKHLRHCPHESNYQLAESERQIQERARGMRVVVGNNHSISNNPVFNNHHQWTVYVRAEDPQRQSLITRVNFRLHPTFTPQEVMVDHPPFQVTRMGWGTFTVGIDVYLRNQVVSFEHELNFSVPTEESTHSIVFDQPVED
eukprot:NODE_2089_length_989_cov_213.224468_g1709_i0.p1 GENE.NODE_2089_length_989_cov_213.224468_g1709_i0~~NODE_2089_length_989_cov_213.224468_g1709_i0.p1  ORF type:complete len:193 (+),score=44.22 NODE_2089_length_989_cov_213.224468_g1709_i0:341-919(+)